MFLALWDLSGQSPGQQPTAPMVPGQCPDINILEDEARPSSDWSRTSIGDSWLVVTDDCLTRKTNSNTKSTVHNYIILLKSFFSKRLIFCPVLLYWELFLGSRTWVGMGPSPKMCQILVNVFINQVMFCVSRWRSHLKDLSQYRSAIN